MKLGLFGGTFNPIHFGHLRAAVEVQEAFGLERVTLIPAAAPPHKTAAGVAAAEDRLRMARLAVGARAGLAVSDVETRRAGPSYTIDTVRHFRAALPEGGDMVLIMGLDAFLEIDTWKSFRELLALVPLIVLARPDARADSCGHDGQEVERFLAARIAPEVSVCGSPPVFRAPGIREVTLFAMTALDISSSKIRALLREGHSIDYLVPSAVRDYIDTQGLYR
jgi:nicotinate-nucleotide adenylyltransferase